MLDSMMGVRSARVWPHEAAHAIEQKAIEIILNAVMAPIEREGVSRKQVAS